MENADMSILLQFAKFSKGFRISDFEEFIRGNIGVENLEFFGRLAYPNQWQMRVSKPKIREKLVRMGKTRINNRSCWIYPLNQQEIRGFVHWLPNSVTNDQLMEQLNLYGNVLILESQERIIEGRKVESDLRYFCLMLTQGTTKEALPHFLKINGCLCHLAIKGRVPACFHCKEVGHHRTECAKRKAKLNSFCKRDPYTAQPRLRPRGKRHEAAKIEVKDQTCGDKVSSSADSVHSEREIPIDAGTTDPLSLPVLETLQDITEAQENATSDTENELTLPVVLTERTEISCVGTSAASISYEESQGIVEVLQHIQQRISEDLRQRFHNFGNEIAQTLTGGKFSVNQLQNTVSGSASTNLEQETFNEEPEMQTREVDIPRETFTLVEMSGEETNIKGKKEDEITVTLPTMHQVKEDIAKPHEKISNKTEEKTKADSMDKITLIVEETEQTASKTIEKAFQKMGLAAKSLEEPEVTSIESDIDTPQKLVKDETRSELAMLLQAKKISLDRFENTFKKLEEKIANLSIQLASDLTVTNTKVTKEDLDFASQVLKQTKETVGGTLQSTFRKLIGQIEMEDEPPEIIAETSAGSKPPSKIVESSKQPAAILEQGKQMALDIVKQFGKKMKDVVASEINEQKSAAEEKRKDTNLSEFKTVAVSQDYFEVAGVSESTKASENEAEAKKDFSTITGFESQVSKTTPENIDELQKDIRNVFTAFLEKEKLLPETNVILQQVELKVNEVIEKMLNR